MSDRVMGLLADIGRAPEALAHCLDVHVRPDAPMTSVAGRLEGRRLAFTGLGSSRYAALTAASYLRSRGRSAWVETASTGSPTAPARDLALIAISASGRTPEVVDAARRHRGTSLVVAVTNEPESPLATAADLVLTLRAGAEAGGISTLTYRATLAVLGLLSGVRVDGLRAVIDRLSALDRALGTSISEAADLLDGAAAIDVLADGSAIGTAEQAALMLREAPRLPAHAGDTGEWLHADVFLAFPGHRAVIFAGAAANDEVVRTITRRGGEVVMVGAAVDGSALVIPTGRVPGDDPFVRAILESSVADRLAATLWDRAAATG